MSKARSADSRDEELRLALVMNGGVSLAVWIGGVAHEINRFVGETHPVYQELLKLTSTRARVDVISGTSAGGINGAALALGCVYDTSLSSLRELWLSRGSFADLLRNTRESDPPSILDGDGYFLPALEKALNGLTNERPRDLNEAPMDVSLTATMLHGEPDVRPDDLGEPIKDSQHRAKFRYTRRKSHDPFREPEKIAGTMANAARASASFPVAFEPRHYKRGAFKNARTDSSGKFDRYLIDGGVLDNKPIRGALKAIYSMPAAGNVRRVLAYVVPDPSCGAEAKDDEKSMPSIASVAMSSILGIPAAQSIADQLSAIDRQNHEVRRKRHSFAWLASNLNVAQLGVMSENLFPAYRERRIDGLLDYVLDEAYAGIQSVGGDAASAGSAVIGRRTRQWLKAKWLATAHSNPPWGQLIPDAQSRFAFDLECDNPDSWGWGAYALRFIEGIAHDLLRRTQYLAHLLETDSQARADWPEIPRAGEQNASEVDESDANPSLEDRDVNLRNTRGHAGPRDSLKQSGDLAGLWKRVYAASEASNIRLMDSDRIRSAGNDLIALLEEARPELAAQGQEAVETPQSVSYWLRKCIEPSPAKIARLSSHVAELGQVLIDARDLIRRVTSVSASHLRLDEQKELKELKNLYALLLEDEPGLNDLVQRLLQLEVVYYSVAGRGRLIDASVELVQVSGRGASPWGGETDPNKKLNGMQLAHFGAFYRRSWRANDWMVGRLDGINRIIGIALNPDRLHRLYGGKPAPAGSPHGSAAEYVHDYLYALAVTTALPGHREPLGSHWNREAVMKELEFLNAKDSRVPETLPVCATALTRRLHLEVLCTELPNIARNAISDVASGATHGVHADSLIARMNWEMSLKARQHNRPLSRIRNRFRRLFSRPDGESGSSQRSATGADFDAQAAIEAFQQCPVGSETLDQEAKSDLLTRTATHTITVSHGALTGKRSGMGKLSAILRVLNLPIRFLNLLTENYAYESRTTATIQSVVLAAGFFFVILSLLGGDKLEALAPVGWSLLIAWFATVAMRQTRPIVAISVVAVCGLLVYFSDDGWSVVYTAVGIATVILAALFLPTWVFGALISLFALWWTTGQPNVAAFKAAFCEGPMRGSDCGLASDIASGSLFVNALGPLIAVFVLSLIAHLGSRKPKSS